jgi:hypothetical protein
VDSFYRVGAAGGRSSVEDLIDRWWWIMMTISASDTGVEGDRKREGRGEDGAAALFWWSSGAREVNQSDTRGMMAYGRLCGGSFSHNVRMGMTSKWAMWWAEKRFGPGVLGRLVTEKK